MTLINLPIADTNAHNEAHRTVRDYMINCLDFALFLSARDGIDLDRIDGLFAAITTALDPLSDALADCDWTRCNAIAAALGTFTAQYHRALAA